MKMDSPRVDLVLCITRLGEDNYSLAMTRDVPAGEVPDAQRVVMSAASGSRRAMVDTAVSVIRMLKPQSLGVSSESRGVVTIGAATLAGICNGEISADDLLI